MDILIKKVYRCGNSMGIVYLNEDNQRIATLVGEWDYFLAKKGMKYNGMCRGKGARKLYELLEAHITSQRKRRAARKIGLDPSTEPATERQVDYAYDLSRRYCRGEWGTVFAGGWFRQPPTRDEIAALGKRRCSEFISDLKAGY